MFGHPVELLVTDKASYRDTGPGMHWRRAEARAVARRVHELVDRGDATPGEIVLLFAAGTDAEWYEQELRALGLPTYRATGRGYFGQQQVVDLLAYLRLVHNRYDDQALVTVLASPFVGLSNDALVLLRRSAPKRPLFVGVERGVPELDADDARLLAAFKQRYERISSGGAAPAAGAALRGDRRRARLRPRRARRAGTAAAATPICASSRGSRARTRSCAAATSRASSASSATRRPSARASWRRSRRRRGQTRSGC